MSDFYHLAETIAFFCESLKEKVLVVPGEIMGLPGYIRLSLTCNDDMVDFALPVFERLFYQEAKAEPDVTRPKTKPSMAGTKRRPSLWA